MTQTISKKNRLATRFAQLKKEGRGALVPYLEAFDPDRATSLAILKGMPEAGADVIEVGVPFSDPSADGPTIQLAAKRALQAGSTLKDVLGLVAEFRQGDNETPIVLMGYLNPIDRFGPEKFCRAAAEAGVDGLIIVDLPPEEADMVAPFAKQYGLDLVILTAPTTPQERLNAILKNARGFVYYVSIAGITGTKSGTEEQITAAMKRIRRATDLPVVTGFGIRTPEQAGLVSRLCEGAVVASALITTLASTLDDNGQATEKTVPAVLGQIRELAAGVRNARS